MDIDSRPVIFYYGCKSAKDRVEEFSSSSLAAQPVQWSRRPGLPSRSVHVDPSFVPLDISDNVKNGLVNRSAHPVAYIFVCFNDPDYYANQGKSELSQWFIYLSSNNLTDWLFITITDKSKKVSSKNSIITKMKADFSIESVDCLIDLPNDYETYPSAWQTLLVKLRNAVLRAFSSTLSARELRAKELLESQKEGNWDFMEYYFCQEEIVSLYCCLSMYEEALDYMDRVESCLTSELAMAAENGPASWVRSLLSNPCETLVSTPNIISTFPDPLRVERVRTRKANLFELRSHILSRQCALLQATDRIAELPLRAVRTIRLASKESRDLKLRVSPSQLYFWTFICSLQTLEIFRRGTPCSIKPEHFRKLRQKYLIENKIFQASSLHICSPSVLTTEDESICPSTLSETASSILMSARLEALESLDFLEDASLQTEGTFNILARAVFASVVADDSAKSGRIVSHNQILIGTSQWTVDLWRRACTALARLGRYLELWPNAERSSDKDALNSTQDIMLLSMLKLLRNLTSSNNESEKPGHLHFAGSFGAQLAVAFISPESFEETYRKFAGACIFFQFCYGAKRASMYTSLELADFYRDARKFIQAESLYQRATEVLMKTSWTELATYSLLQQAFCQQVQWRTETVDTIEASVFKRYVQTALILSITPADYLENCYKILSNRCSHFDSLFEDGTASYEEAILPPWWPEDWWKHAVSTVAEHYARISSSSTSDVLPLHRVCPPLAVLSLRPLFHLSLIELDDANPHTGRQVVRIHLFVAGVRPILARVSLRGRSTVVRDWTEPPLSNESNDLRSCDQAKFFNVDLAVEGSLPGAPASSAENAFTTKDHGSGHSTSGSSNAAKESVMRRLFRRSSVRGRSSRGMFRQSNNNLNATDDGSVSDGKPTRRPASIDFLAFRGRLSTPDRASPLSLASLQDGLTLSSDYDRDVRSSAATPDETSTFGASVFSAEGVRRHKKGFSMSDWSGLLQAFKQTKNAAVPKPQQTHPNKNHHLTPVVTTTQSEIDHNDIYFYPRCHARRLCKCRLPEAAKELVDSKGDALTLHPGYNYLMLETAQCGFHLPREISIAIYNGTEDAVSGSSIFNFTGLIAPEHFGSTWSNRTLLGRLLPQVEQVAALRVPKSIDSPNKSAKVSANVVASMNQPVFVTARVGSLAMPRHDGGGRPTGLVLSRTLRSDSPTEAVRGQRYSVIEEPEEILERSSEIYSNTTDLGELVAVPDEKASDKADEFAPGMRLCLQRSFLLRPRSNEKFAIILPTGQPQPLSLTTVNPLFFKAKVSYFQRRFALIQLRVSVREITCPVIGCVNEAENPPRRNPFYSQRMLAFKICSPKLTLKVSGDPTPFRSPSVVEFVPTSPSFPFLHKATNDAGGVGNSVFFSENDANVTSSTTSGRGNTGPESGTNGIDNDSEVKQQPTERQIEHKLLDPDRSNGVISPGRPFTFNWALDLALFESVLRPMSKPDRVGVSAVFTFLAGTTFDETCSRPLRYSCNLVRLT